MSAISKKIGMPSAPDGECGSVDLLETEQESDVANENMIEENDNEILDENDLWDALRMNLEFLYKKFAETGLNENDLARVLDDYVDRPEELVIFPQMMKRLQVFTGARKYIDGINRMEVGGKPLLVTQKEVALCFYEWVKSKFGGQPMMGHVVMPTASGKTHAAVMMAAMAGGKSVYVANSNNDGAQALSAYSAQFGEDNAGLLLGKSYDNKKDHIITTFPNHSRWEDIDWENVNILFVDEADVNGLSETRKAILKKAAREHGVIVVGMSATEQQASGKKISDVFPDEILRLPMPDSLPKCLEIGLIADMELSDLHVDSTLLFDRSDFTGDDLNDVAVNEFIRSNAWNNAILNHYRENFRIDDKDYTQGIVVFRNNITVRDFVEQAEREGIKAVPFTGDMDMENLEKIKQLFQKGEIDLLVGSKLLGRGLDLPGINVVYNSTITYSPQIFWQVDGRGFRRDPNNPAKKARIIAVIPTMVKSKKTRAEVGPEDRPLAHATFFEPDYFLPKPKTKSSKAISTDGTKKPPVTLKSYDLSKNSAVTSIENVCRIIIERRRRSFGLDSRPLMMADAFSMVHEFNGSILTVLESVSSYRKGRITLPALNNGEDDYLAKTDQDWIGRTRPGARKQYRYKDEKHDLKEYLDLMQNPSEDSPEKMKAVMAKIIEGNSPALRALVNFLVRVHGLEEAAAEDLYQESVISIIKRVNSAAERGKIGTPLMNNALCTARDAMRPLTNYMNLIKLPVLAPVAWQEYMDISETGELPDYATFEELPGFNYQNFLSLFYVMQENNIQPITGENVVPTGECRDSVMDMPDLQDEVLVKKEVNELLGKVLKMVDAREEKVLKNNCGMGRLNNEPQTFKEIGEEENLSHTRMAMIFQEACGKIRKMSKPHRCPEAYGLRAYCKNEDGIPPVVVKMEMEEEEDEDDN